jgi:hypothetical protein
MTGITYLIANSLKILDQSELIFLKHLINFRKAASQSFYNLLPIVPIQFDVHEDW